MKEAYRRRLSVRWPSKVSAGVVTAEVGRIIDVLPTCAEAAGANYPQQFNDEEVIPVEGLSLIPILAGGQGRGHERLFWVWAGNRAIREGRWKLCWVRKVGSWELYDMLADRTETKDLAQEHPVDPRGDSEDSP